MHIKNLFPSPSERFLKKHKKIVQAVLDKDEEMTKLTDEQLKSKTEQFKERLQNGSTLDDILVEAFAVCREASTRVLGMKHFPVQIMGGLILHKGEIAEMKTGEGKTLVGTLPTYLNALAGNGVHVISVNDYLTKRDWEIMEPLYTFLGMTSGYVISGMSPNLKQLAYKKDITYVVNQQLGFDYLFDNLTVNPDEKMQRGLNYAIIDEVDAILLDEARTPMVISKPQEEVSPLYPIVNATVARLKEEEDYEKSPKDTDVHLTDDGMKKIERIFGIKSLVEPEHTEFYYLIRQCLLAHYHYERDKHYIVHENKVELIDENTGRVTPGRRYQGGLHQALEAKEGVTIEKETVNLASITYQYFFRMYNKISGMTGTAATEEEEFQEVYNLDVVIVPTNKDIQRIDNPDIVYSTREKKMAGILKDIQTAHAKGQPVLVGVSTISQSEELHHLLKKEKIKHHVLNAKNHALEAEIISQAGQFGGVTVATNMAGRGTDIKLGEGVKEVGGLRIIGTERNVNRRVDNQLRGRAGRQGDVGESQFHVSLEDELTQTFGTDSMKSVIEAMGVANGNEAGVVQNSFLSGFVERSQKMLEGRHFDARKSTVEYDSVINDQRILLYAERDQLLHDEVTVMEIVNKVARRVVENKINALEINSPDDAEKTIAYVEKTFLLPYTLTEDFFQSCTDIKERLIARILKHIEMNIQAFDSASPERKQLLRSRALKIVDKHWMNHMDIVDNIRKTVHYQAYSQKQPLEVFLFQTTEEFGMMSRTIQDDFVTLVATMPAKEPEEPVYVSFSDAV